MIYDPGVELVMRFSRQGEGRGGEGVDSISVLGSGFQKGGRFSFEGYFGGRGCEDGDMLGLGDTSHQKEKQRGGHS